MYSASSPLPLLLLSNVVGDISEGCYLLLRASLLWRPSHLKKGQYFKKTDCRCVQQKLHHSQATLPFLMTSTMTADPSLLELFPMLTPGDSGMWSGTLQTLEVSPSTSFPRVQSLR